jgi:hypothetical protein
VKAASRELPPAPNPPHRTTPNTLNPNHAPHTPPQSPSPPSTPPAPPAPPNPSHRKRLIRIPTPWHSFLNASFRVQLVYERSPRVRWGDSCVSLRDAPASRSATRSASSPSRTRRARRRSRAARACTALVAGRTNKNGSPGQTDDRSARVRVRFRPFACFGRCRAADRRECGRIEGTQASPSLLMLLSRQRPRRRVVGWRLPPGGSARGRSSRRRPSRRGR